jgi:hypothetical protein
MEYLERSQEIRGLIESDPNILDRIGSSLGLEKVRDGTKHSILRLGSIEEKVHVAVRLAPAFVDHEYAQADLEFCAQQYANYSRRGLRVPDFAIGAIIAGLYPFLVVEDLTRGGEFTIEDNLRFYAEHDIEFKDTCHGFIEPGHIECYFDFDLFDLLDGKAVKHRMLESPIFFRPEHVIEL